MSRHLLLIIAFAIVLCNASTITNYWASHNCQGSYHRCYNRRAGQCCEDNETFRSAKFGGLPKGPKTCVTNDQDPHDYCGVSQKAILTFKRTTCLTGNGYAWSGGSIFFDCNYIREQMCLYDRGLEHREDITDRDTKLPDIKCTSSHKPDVVGAHGYEFFVYGTDLASKYGKVALNNEETAEILALVKGSSESSLEDLLAKFGLSAVKEGEIQDE
ncbi:hypothetical protein FCIRC_9054 [Fusarium circinatum]|uniref:Secreted protein n=1 Tax=Fusarium circinatum TaxID=48490 RepID=A0A8H5TI18_FUSCI|nr:hypothetical protein FCIRC_9054 [Fusarium circinatum]